MPPTYSLIIIGGGPGGYTAAIHAAQNGFSTAIVEETGALGGVCLHKGCIPTKSLLRSAEAYDIARNGAEFGVRCQSVEADFGAVMERCRNIPKQGAGGIDFLMKKYKIAVYKGRGTLAGNGNVTVGDTALSAENIILATGAHPSSIPGIIPDGVRVLTAPDLFQLRECPKTVLIIGAGAIGVQFAGFFKTFGAAVTVVEVAEQVLPGIDREVAKRLVYSFKKRGIEVKTGTRMTSCAIGEKTCRTELSDGSTVESDIIIVAAGFAGNVEGIGAETAGIEIERGFFKVDDRFRTSAPGIYAIGDCIGPPMLAHAAAREGERAVDAMLGKETKRLDPRLVPIAIYTHPNIAGVGLSEETARAQGYDCLIGNCPFKIIGKAVAMGETEGFAKVIIDRASRKFLGAHIIGMNADEILQEVVLAMTAGITAEQLLDTIHPHPTTVEAVYEAAAAALGRPVNT